MYDDTEGGLLQIEGKPLKKYLSNVVQVQDPNTTEYEKVLTNTNTPDGLYYYIQTMIWADGIKGQVAYGYNTNKVYYRYKYPASAGWSNWTLIGGNPKDYTSSIVMETGFQKLSGYLYRTGKQCVFNLTVKSTSTHSNAWKKILTLPADCEPIQSSLGFSYMPAGPELQHCVCVYDGNDTANRNRAIWGGITIQSGREFWISGTYICK